MVVQTAGWTVYFWGVQMAVLMVELSVAWVVLTADSSGVLVD